MKRIPKSTYTKCLFSIGYRGRENIKMIEYANKKTLNYITNFVPKPLFEVLLQT